MNRKRKKLLIASLIVGLLLIGAFVAVKVFVKEDKPNITIGSSTSESSEEETEDSSSSSSTSSSENKKVNNDPNYQTALNTLEYPDEKADDKHKANVVAAFQTAQASVSQERKIGDLKGTIDNRMSMTADPMVQTFGMAIAINKYSVDLNSIEVYKSKNPDVLQFVCTLKANGKKDSYWAGNYNIYAKQLQLVSYHGGDIGATFG